MHFPIWVPWVLVVALALPVVLRRSATPVLTRKQVAVALLPAIVMAVYAGAWSLDRRQVTQEELDGAAQKAATALGGGYGSVRGERVATLVGDELGRPIQVRESDPAVRQDLDASYTFEVRPVDGDADVAACLDVTLQVVDQDMPDLYLAQVRWQSGPCAPQP